MLLKCLVFPEMGSVEINPARPESKPGFLESGANYPVQENSLKRFAACGV
jgi:hypothetical protein